MDDPRPITSESPIDALSAQDLASLIASPVAVLDGAGNVRFANGAWSRLLDGAGDGGPLSDLLDGDCAAELLQHVREALEQGSDRVVTLTLRGAAFDAAVRPLDGEDESVLIVANPVATGLPTAPECDERFCLRSADGGRMDGLTDAERTVLGLIVEGRSMREIADAMDRSVKTVEWYRGTLGKKLGARSRIDLARAAFRAGLTPIIAGQRA